MKFRVTVDTNAGGDDHDTFMLYVWPRLCEDIAGVLADSTDESGKLYDSGGRVVGSWNVL